MQKLLNYLSKPLYGHTLFWIIIYLYFIFSVSNTGIFANTFHLLASYGIIVAGQMIVAYIALEFLLPKLLNKKKYVQFTVSLLLLLFAVFVLYNFVKVIWFDKVYYDSYNEITRNFAERSFSGKIFDFSIFLSKCVLFIAPSLLLLTSKLYRDQQRFLQLKEQKKSAELSALKHQLNPHFLFNTLNNLYSLALIKSDKTAEVIEKLSEILDYILYRSGSNFVSILKEIELIENYINLEKIRYGKRVKINLNKQITHEVKIAPLILLTFIENAFKHGVSQELNEAKIDIGLSLKDGYIIFTIYNSKPSEDPRKLPNNKQKSLGLENVKSQLDLLYPNNEYNLEINNNSDSFGVNLCLKSK